MVSPGGEFPGRGSWYSAKGLVSRILFHCGHSSRRRIAADTHQRPTRRFRRFWSRLAASGRCAAEPGSRLGLPSLFGLAPCGVYPASGLTVGAVRSYRTFSPLPLRGAALWTSPSDCPHTRFTRIARAVCFLWHWPSTGLEARVPDVIRHTALRSSDFPPPEPRLLETPAATARSSCQGLVYRDSRRSGSTVGCLGIG